MPSAVGIGLIPLSGRLIERNVFSRSALQRPRVGILGAATARSSDRSHAWRVNANSASSWAMRLWAAAN